VRVVADTNVLVSALIFPGGSPEAVYRLVLEGKIELVTSRPLLTELGRVLTEKFGWNSNQAEEAVAQLIRVAELVEPPDGRRARGWCADAEDQVGTVGGPKRFDA